MATTGADGGTANANHTALAMYSFFSVCINMYTNVITLWISTYRTLTINFIRTTKQQHADKIDTFFRNQFRNWPTVDFVGY